jgi:hypothetical protein
VSENATADQGFESLSAFDKPGHCEVTMKIPTDTESKKVELGYRRGDTKLYYQDGAIAGSYNLPKGLEEMTREEIDKTFPQEHAFIAPRENILQMWEDSKKRYLD